jgi:hypothetical protein
MVPEPKQLPDRKQSAEESPSQFYQIETKKILGHFVVALKKQEGRVDWSEVATHYY